MPEPTSTVPDDAGAATSAADSYAPYGQLVKMLLPSAGSIAIYDATGELLWCSDGYERPDLRALLEQLRSEGDETLVGRGSVRSTTAGVPTFVAALRGGHQQSLGSLVVELSQGQNGRYAGSMVVSLLRPVLDCLESRMNLEHTVLTSDRDDHEGLDLLLSVDEHDREDASALEKLLGHSVEHLGCAVGAILIPDANLTITCAADPTLANTQLLDRTQKHLLAWVQLNNRPMVVNRVNDSTDAAYKILSCPVRDPNNRVAGLVALFRTAAAEDFELRDVRILEFVSRKVVGILASQHDSLTGLVNPLIFERRVQNLLDNSSGSGPQALLYIDIDKLQLVNEAFGLHAGDEVIQRLAEVIRVTVGGTTLASRVGGDRFAVFLPAPELASRAKEVGQRILAAASQLGYMNGSQAVPVSASIGVAFSEHPGERAAHLIASAELACKRAKQQGRNRIDTFQEENSLLLPRQRQLIASASLRDALLNNEFRLEAQPIVGLRVRPGEIVALELLVRMHSHSGELVAPDKFFDAAERYELLPALDRWVVCTALETLKRLDPDRLSYEFTINVSAQSLARPTFARFALDQVAQAALPPSSFCFEIKESAAVNHLQHTEKLIRELTEAGCKIALDDFGFGLSSLAHLKRLPVQYLKIDGRFVRRILDDRVAESIVSGITKAARTLGVGTIAKHVESAALAEKLHDLDVDLGQGFFLGRPEAFAGLLPAAEGVGPRPAAASRRGT